MRIAMCLGLLALASCAGDPSGAVARGNGDSEGPDGEAPSEPGGLTGGGGDEDPGVGVTVHLQRAVEGGSVLSFGLPLPKAAVQDAAGMQVLVASAPVAATIRETLAYHDASGSRTGTRAVVVQLPASLMSADGLDVEVRWTGGAGSSAGEPLPFASDEVSAVATATARTTTRTIVQQGGSYALSEGPVAQKPLFTAREPRVLATFPEGYLARTGILGPQVRAADAQPGLAFFSSALDGFASSAMYRESYALNPDADSVVDPIADFSAWLYDRCATFLTAHTHLGDVETLRHGFQNCSYYAGKIELSGANRGIFTGKPTADTKYSHLRGLYAYYALTGDESALEAGKAIADMWYADPLFVVPYRDGHVRGRDKLWTERLLGTSMEGLLYGHQLTGDLKYKEALGEMVDTAHRHITGDAGALAEVNPGMTFPPQNCFIHSGEQHADAMAGDPWCSPWMSAMIIDPLLGWEEQTGDTRVAEIFVRLSRFLRDVGTSYFTNDLLNDSFLSPSVCDNPGAGDNRRRLVPLYGAGIRSNGGRATFGEWDDWQHCADATAITAAGLRALKQAEIYDEGAIGPFASEGEALLALHHELVACAERGFAEATRTRRDPANWTSAELAAGAGNPTAFITQNRIGYPLHVNNPQRRFSWWFNYAMLQQKLLAEAGIEIGEITPGAVQPAGCP
ncbi:hypothetical protein [Chondromyces crocatus]|uniref:Lipoprotein n=1 Tax=Chondromyces crocatus TaxID=52 RepID=A0A0K1EGD1_CHOCO|nr:hypothetical protein [Chondromyces crocatus]AKT39931.1 uncharacterized protein CMC5_040820 [Chondromyces crocatus]